MLLVPSMPPAEPVRRRSGLLATFQRLSPYLWPHGRPDLQRRVFLAFGLLLVAKLVTMLTPFTFKWATDALVAVTGGADPAAGRRLRRVAVARADPADDALRPVARSPWPS